MSDFDAATDACTIFPNLIFCITREVRRPEKGGFLFSPRSTNPDAPLPRGIHFCATTSRPGLGPMHETRGIGTPLGRCSWWPISSAVGNYASLTQTRTPLCRSPRSGLREICGTKASGRHSKFGPVFGPHHIGPAHRGGTPPGHNSKIIGLLLLRLKGSHPAYEQADNFLLHFFPKSWASERHGPKWPVRIDLHRRSLQLPTSDRMLPDSAIVLASYLWSPLGLSPNVP